MASIDRDKLTAQVKSEYARLAAKETQQHFHQTTDGMSAEKYYENLLNLVLGEIASGTFDSCHSGKEIMEEVAKDKHKWLSKWGQNAT